MADGGFGAQAQPKPFTDASYFNEDAKKPRFDKVVNGILVGPSAEPRSGLCMDVGTAPQYVDPEKAVGTPLDIKPSYLPASVELTATSAVECDGTLVSLLKEYNVPPKATSTDPNVPPLWAGGTLSVLRTLSVTPAFYLDGAADRIGPTSVKDRPAALMRPVMPAGVDAGIGNAAVVIQEDFGLTVIQGTGLPLGEFEKIADGLY